MPDKKQLEKALKQHFGFPDFRLGQRDVIRDALDGHNTLVVMPTGTGKSLCYQLSAMLLDGVTIIVSPLIALMKDQVDALQQRDIPATCINSSLSRSQLGERLSGLRNGRYKMLYVAPERFRNSGFLHALDEVSVSMIAIDEAHCISQWGHDFRPDYLRLRHAIERIPSAVVMALTATATPSVRADIVKQLGIEQQAGAPRLHVHGFSRPNLTLAVTRTARHVDKVARIMRIADQYPTGIIYCSTRRNTERVTEYLAEKGVHCRAYHAGLEGDQRRAVQEEFISGAAPIVVATNAFGMGVDRHDLRFVIHWDIPGSLEAYYQEVGRAGRDGLPAHCELLFNHADIRTQQFFLDGSNPQPTDVIAVWDVVKQACAEGPVSASGDSWAEQAGIKNAILVRTCMAILERAGMITRALAPGTRSYTTALCTGADASELQPHFEALHYKRQLDESKLATMRKYALSNTCRHAFILHYFGEKGYRSSCDANCDRCTAQLDDSATEAREPTDEEWVLLQKVLSCIAHMRGRFGVKRVIQVLRGSQSTEVLSRGLEQLSTYGILCEQSERFLRQIIDALIADGSAAITDGKYPTIAVTHRGVDVAKRRTMIKLAWPENGARKRKLPAKQRATGSIGDGIYARLSEWRSKKARGRPLYTVCSNRTLEELAAERPRTMTELEAIHGMGPTRIARYGAELIELFSD